MWIRGGWGEGGGREGGELARKAEGGEGGGNRGGKGYYDGRGVGVEVRGKKQGVA